MCLRTLVARLSVGDSRWMASSAPSTTAFDPTADFFRSLPGREPDPLLRTAKGSIRFDVVDAGHVEHWWVSMSGGTVSVSRGNRRADAKMVVERDLMDRLVTGRANAMAALLRGAVIVEGELGLLLAFQRIFPGPPTSAQPGP